MKNHQFRGETTACLVCLLSISVTSVACSSGSNDNDAGSAGTTSSECREYMTEAILQGPMFDGSIGTAPVTAAWDATTNSYAATMVAAGITQSVVRTYQGVADFVDEAKVVGPRLCSTVTNAGSYSSSETYVYDSQRRLSAIEVFEPGPSGHGAFTWGYSTWDDKGRPTGGTLGGPNIDCQGILVGIDYDDQLRKASTLINMAAGQGAGCGGQVIYSWQVFDVNGNVVDELHSSSNPNAPSVKTTIAKTARICK